MKRGLPANQFLLLLCFVRGSRYVGRPTTEVGVQVRIAVACGLIFGLFFAEACYQRHVYRKREFLASIETLRASLGELTIAYVAFNMAATRAAQAMRQVLEEGWRRARR